MKRLICLFVTCLFLMPLTVGAQQYPKKRLVKDLNPNLTDARAQAKVSWNLMLPLGDTADFTPSISPSGFTFEFSYRFRPELTIGLFGGWQSFGSKEFDTRTEGLVTVTGTEFRDRTIIPFMGALTYHYSLTDDDNAQAYVGLGVGTYYIESLSTLGVLSAEYDASNNFGLAPSIGLVGEFLSQYFFAEFRWNYAFKNDTHDAQNYLNFNLGMLFL